MDRIFSNLAAWLFLISGMLLIGGVMLFEPQQRLRELEHERDLAYQQAAGPANERQALEALLDGLHHYNPVVLESLALIFRHQQRWDTQAIAIDDPHVMMAAGESLVFGDEPSPIRQWAGMVSQSRRPQVAPPSAVMTTWERVSTGRNRYAVLALGIVCLLIGLVPPRESKPPTQTAAAMPARR